MNSEPLLIPDESRFNFVASYAEADADFAYSLVIPLLDGRRGCLEAEPDRNETQDLPIPWNLQRAGEPDEVVAWSPGFGHFRAVLAKVGFIYLQGEPYGGFKAAVMSYRGRRFIYNAYMSNHNYGMSGFWLRLYVKPLDVG